MGTGFLPSVTSGGATRHPGLGLQSSVQAPVETQPPGKEEEPGPPGLSGKSIHSAVTEYFLNTGTITGQVRQGPSLATFMGQMWALP